MIMMNGDLLKLKIEAIKDLIERYEKGDKDDLSFIEDKCATLKFIANTMNDAYHKTKQISELKVGDTVFIGENNGYVGELGRRGVSTYKYSVATVEAIKMEEVKDFLQGKLKKVNLTVKTDEKVYRDMMFNVFNAELPSSINKNRHSGFSPTLNYQHVIVGTSVWSVISLLSTNLEDSIGQIERNAHVQFNEFHKKDDDTKERIRNQFTTLMLKYTTQKGIYLNVLEGRMDEEQRLTVDCIIKDFELRFSEFIKEYGNYL